MNLEAYLISKKIDSAAFQKAEPELWKAWNEEIEHMHPNSFTMQKLNLINPIRRKYPLPLPVAPEKPVEPSATQAPASSPPPDTISKPVTPPSSTPKPTIPRPVFKPKPKMQ